ncbi:MULTISPECIES: lactonase family protein [unclassified Streptomyces]|uniref:lactonase family protein n=1 Tax=unclassified Streptomyces TaxID=2593676 RepID=UPI0033B8EDFC
MGGSSTGRAFMGSFTSAGGLGVTVAEVDRNTGALTVLGSSDAVPDPSFLALGPGGEVLYAVGESAPGSAAAFDVSGDVPALLGPVRPVRADGPTHLALAAGHLVTANYGSGSVTALPVLADGTLGEVSSVVRHEGGGPDSERQEGPHAHQVLPDPSGRWVVSVDLGTDSVRISALDPATGTLEPHGETVLRPGTGPRHLAFHPSGRYAYVLNELVPTLIVCRWDAEAGRIEPLAEVLVLPESDPADDPDGSVRAYPSEVVVARDGRFLWTATRGHDSISVLTLDETGEKAALVATVGCGGRWPRDLTLDPSGQWLYAANEHSGNVSWFAVDAETGVPQHAGSVEVPAVSCVVLG